MTRYDLEAYQELTSIIPIEFDGLGGVADTGSDGDGEQGCQSGILIPASRFSTMEGPIRDNVLIIPLSMDYKHLIFGLYVAIPKGIYSVDFQVELLDVDSETSTGALHFDAADSENQLCQRVVSFAELQTGIQPVLEFVREKDDALIEFRVSGDCCADGAVRFRGIVLGKLASTTYLFDQAPRYQFPKSPEMVTLRKRRRRSWRLRLHPWRQTAAMDAFTQADQARDRQDWTQAARLYGKGLQLDPDNFPMWVQYGHCLKQEGRFAKAEAAYGRAIDLCPEDADFRRCSIIGAPPSLRRRLGNWHVRNCGGVAQPRNGSVLFRLRPRIGARFARSAF